MMAPPPVELNIYRIEQLERQIKAQADEIKSLEARMDAREAARVAVERNQLIAGLVFVGGTLGGIIWAYRAIIFRGAP